jgi:hypothetical protein
MFPRGSETAAQDDADSPSAPSRPFQASALISAPSLSTRDSVVYSRGFSLPKAAHHREAAELRLSR